MKQKKSHTHTRNNQQKAATVYAVSITHATRVNSLLSSTCILCAQKLNILRNLKKNKTYYHVKCALA